MEVYVNEAGELGYEALNPQTTVTDLINALVQFCQIHIDCTICRSTCCSGFIVYADNIFIKNLSNTALRTMDERDSQNLPLRVLKMDRTLKWTVPQNADGKCKFLSRKGRCLIYEARPLVCRMHTCLKCQPDFKETKDNIYYAYQEALKIEMKYLLSTGMSPATAEYSCANPLVGMKNYNAVICDIVKWSQSMRRIPSTQFGADS
ncbi:MAG: Fe-S-cluster oxidoreductase [Sporomusa sp.]|jgi:Fe-S-cluster containining protein|nr:Fe-S-cluster oxidoreductase [Sporomusa sp.]